jgi:N-acetylneuraminate synthase
MSFIVAEIGVNHNGDLELAKKLVDEAILCKVDAVKFQTFHTNLLVTKDAPKANYQIENTKNNDTQNDMLKELELSDENFKELKSYCDTKKIKFISTPFDIPSVNLLNDIGVDIFKIGSGDITNFQLLKKVASTNKPIILSTGMSSMIEIEHALNYLRKFTNNKITLLHCLSSYPADLKDINLSCISTMKSLGVPVGFSDHTQSLTIGGLAVTLGASIIEKHFTLDNNLCGPDHKASLNPEHMKIYVQNIRESEIIYGNGVKSCAKSEENTKLVARRSLITTRDIFENEIINNEDLISLRPNTGIGADKLEDVIGKQVNKFIPKDTLLNESYFVKDSQTVYVVGTGYMAKEYVKSLLKLNKNIIVIGNTKKTCEDFEKLFNINVISGGFEQYKFREEPNFVIIATPIDSLINHMKIAISNNAKNILVEKPAGLDYNELNDVLKLADKTNIRVAYNRRFHASVLKAKEIIKNDGGVTSFKFDFTELVDRIDFKKFSKDVLNKWIISMSSHLIDLAFFLVGKNVIFDNIAQFGKLAWHKYSIYSGSGTCDNIPFVFNANWNSAGRWKLEINTKNNLLLFCPLEKLQITKRNCLNPEPVIIDTSDELEIKHGVYLQTKCFLEDPNNENLLSLKEQYDNIKNIYNVIGGY